MCGMKKKELKIWPLHTSSCQNNQTGHVFFLQYSRLIVQNMIIPHSLFSTQGNDQLDLPISFFIFKPKTSVNKKSYRFDELTFVDGIREFSYDREIAKTFFLPAGDDPSLGWHTIMCRKLFPFAAT